ncbi:MAG TPA: hypothetical protein VD833_03550 [Vicinamibacterales bacterium]|nr:hypothetical protein [Vicinamibacterales bacterium]
MVAGGCRRRVHGLAAGTLAFTICGAAIVLAQATDPAFGTWKLNVAKSTFSPGPPPKEMTATIAPDGTGRKVSVTGLEADGTPIKWGYTANFDREEYKLSGNNPNADVVSLRRVSANTTRATFKLAGKETLVNGVSVSEDGKTLTVASSGVDGKGRTVKSTLVFEKQ